MDDVTTQEDKVALSYELRAFLGGWRIVEKLNQIGVDSGLAGEALEHLQDEVLHLVSDGYDPQAFLAHLKEAGLTPQGAQALATRVLQEILHDVAEDIPNFARIAAELGVQLDQELMDQLSPLLQFTDSIDLIKTDHMAKRLMGMLQEIWDGRHAREEIAERMTHSVKVNGLGFTAEQAQGILMQFDALERPVVAPVVSEEPVVEQVPEPVALEEPAVAEDPVMETVSEDVSPEKPVSAPKPAPVIEPVVGTESAFEKPAVDEQAEHAAEIEQIKQERSHIVQISEPVSLEKIVKTICGSDQLKFEDVLLSDRCAKIVESRVRGVRDARGAMQTMERPVNKGGLGITGRRLADVMQVLEAHTQAYEKQHEGQQVARKESYVADRIAVQEKKTELAQAQEKLLSKRYTDLTGKAPVESVSPASPGHSRTSAAVSAHHEMRSQEGKIDADRVKAALKSAQQVPAKAHGTPSMQEVQFEKRLSGPVEELARMNLTDFRRLSKDPKQASTKLKDKVDLIESQQGYAERIEAIKAWRGSPLHARYVELTRRAVLEGVPVTQLLENHRAAGEQTLTNEELTAVMQVNSALRF